MRASRSDCSRRHRRQHPHSLRQLSGRTYGRRRLDCPACQGWRCSTVYAPRRPSAPPSSDPTGHVAPRVTTSTALPASTRDTPRDPPRDSPRDPPSGSAEGVQFDNVGIGPHQPLNRAQAIASQFLDGPLQLGTRLAQRAQTISERRADRGQRQARQGDLRGEGRCEQACCAHAWCVAQEAARAGGGGGGGEGGA